MATRKYEQRQRAEAARETRRRIIDAVYERLRAAPSERVDIGRVARAAGVARPTVYGVFGSRAGLFDAVGADLLERGGLAETLRATRVPDARAGLRAFFPGTVGMYAAHRDVMRPLMSMALLDAAAVGGSVQRLEEDRAAGVGRLARRLADQGELRPDVEAGQAADLLWLLSGFDAFDQLFTGRGLTAERTAAALLTTAERSLCR